MPGFVIQGVGAGEPEDFRPMYSYTWKVDKIFDADVGPLGILLEQCSLPTFLVNVHRIQGTALNYKYASDITWEDVRLTFYDTVKLEPKLREWRKRVWSVDRGLGVAGDYKRDTIIMQYTDDWKDSNKWTLKNSWPSNIKYGDLTYVQSTAKVVDVVVTYDWVEEDATPGGGGTGGGGGGGTPSTSPSTPIIDPPGIGPVPDENGTIF